MLELGIKAPDFELPDQNGEMHKLSDYAGKKVILYFYPKDNTPGCTKQACGFSERYPQFTEKGAVILGVSKDSVASHKRFEEKYGLAFTLLILVYYPLDKNIRSLFFLHNRLIYAFLHSDPAIQSPVLFSLLLTYFIPPFAFNVSSRSVTTCLSASVASIDF